MNRLRTAAFVLCALAPALAPAQSGKVLNEKDVNEAALVNMLTPEPQMRTRSIRVTREGAPPAPAPSASLLITFETNSAQLTPQARQSLEVVGRALKSDKLAEFRFSIEGHADPRGTEAANLRLSQARAESVVAFLVESQQLDRARLKAVGKGQSELMNTANPIAPENRRVTIKTLTD
jgi:outer membrane protein OmpA-like peptidoglycan-associated protein